MFLKVSRLELNLTLVEHKCLNLWSVFSLTRLKKVFKSRCKMITLNLFLINNTYTYGNYCLDY